MSVLYFHLPLDGCTAADIYREVETSNHTSAKEQLENDEEMEQMLLRHLGAPVSVRDSVVAGGMNALFLFLQLSLCLQAVLAWTRLCGLQNEG